MNDQPFDDDLLSAWFRQEMHDTAEHIRTVAGLYCGHPDLTQEDGEGYAICARCGASHPVRLTAEMLKGSMELP